MKPRHPLIADVLRPYYTATELDALERLLAPSMAIALNPLGRVCASNREVEGSDPTNYDAVWVRDSVWAYYGLRAQGADEKAGVVLRGLLDYFSSPKQLKRLETITREPERSQAADGAMQVLHIRFDGKSTAFEDVQSEGHDQIWNHKQNDAVALTALAVGEALLEGWWKPEVLTGQAKTFLLGLPAYWQALRFWQYEDAGAWEEIERVNTSSIALVVRSLEVWQKLLGQSGWLGVSGAGEASALLPELIAHGYARIQKQTPFESPDYPAGAKYREADAALLNLIFPGKLDKQSWDDRRRVLQTVERLVREVGTIRYEGDSYQCAGFWRGEMAPETDSRTDDTSSEAAFAERGTRLKAGTEAQWFFDSWISQAYGILFHATADKEDYKRQVHFFNRALCQLTGPGEKGADGKPVPEGALPESYNTVLEGEKRSFAPSPITPLNWSKACLALALRQLRQSLTQKVPKNGTILHS
ncbi:hypothetical protein K2X33_11050 [bacterium]|nr:hypothetical protein [bacterium]